MLSACFQEPHVRSRGPLGRKPDIHHVSSTCSQEPHVRASGPLGRDHTMTVSKSTRAPAKSRFSMASALNITLRDLVASSVTQTLCHRARKSISLPILAMVLLLCAAQVKASADPAAATANDYLATQIKEGHLNGLTHLLDHKISKVALFDFPAENCFPSFRDTKKKICENAGRNPDHIAMFGLIELPEENEHFHYRVDQKRERFGRKFGHGFRTVYRYQCRYQLNGDDTIKIRVPSGKMLMPYNCRQLGVDLADGGVVQMVIPNSIAAESGIEKNFPLIKVCSGDITRDIKPTDHHQNILGKIKDVKEQAGPGAVITFEFLKTDCLKWTRPFHVVFEDGKHYVPVAMEYRLATRLNCNPDDLAEGRKLNWIDLTHNVTLREWAKQFRTFRYSAGVLDSWSCLKAYFKRTRKVKVDKFNICHDLALDLFRFFIRDDFRDGEKETAELLEIPECPKCNPSGESCFVCQNLAAKYDDPTQIKLSMLRPFRKAEIGDIVYTKGCCRKVEDMVGKRSAYDRTAREYLQELCLITRFSSTIGFRSLQSAVLKGARVRPDERSREVMIMSSKKSSTAYEPGSVI